MESRFAMSQPARISVILTSYNHAEFLRESIESVLNQTYPHFELIIVDDASTDQSWEIIQSYSDPRIRAYRKEVNQGGWLINDVLAGMETAEYIAIHHCDDAWEPQKLEKQVAILDGQPQIGAVFSWAKIIDEHGQSLTNKSHYYYKVFEQPNRSRFEWLHYFFYHNNALCHPSVLIRRQCYDDCGAYRYGLAQLGDFDMWVRLCLKYDIHIIPEKLVRFRLQSSQVNTSGDRPEVHIRGEFEFLQIYRNYLQLTNRDDFVKVFPDAALIVEKEEYDIPFALAMVALSLQNPFGRLFGLQVLFNIINDPQRAKKIERIYGFRNLDFIRLSAQHDIFSVVERSEKDAQLQKLFQQSLDKEESIQALSAQLVETQQTLQSVSTQLQERSRELEERSRELEEKDRTLMEITSSKVWKLALLFRQARLVLVPPNSRRASVLRKLVNGLIRPVMRFVRRERLNEAVDLIRASSLFNADWYLVNNPDVAQPKMDPAQHYLQIGGFEGRDPGPNFSTDWYVETYKDVKSSSINPLLHYLRFGQTEGRYFRCRFAC